MARKEIKMKKDKEAREKLMQQYKDTAQVKDSAAVAIAVKKIVKQKARDKYVRDHKQIWNKNKGKPIAKGEFSSWTDISTSRSETMVENFFGEAIMLHQDHLLGDVLRDRPVIVNTNRQSTTSWKESSLFCSSSDSLLAGSHVFCGSR